MHGNGTILTGDIDFIDETGALVARMSGCECVLDPSLREAYRNNRLAPSRAAAQAGGQ